MSKKIIDFGIYQDLTYTNGALNRIRNLRQPMSPTQCKCNHPCFVADWGDDGGYFACPIGAPQDGGCGFFKWKPGTLHGRLFEKIVETKGTVKKRKVPQPAQIAEDQVDRKKSEGECVICFEELEQRIALLPCGHATFCKTCAKKLNICPICKSNIVSQSKIYL